jgi:hypothetical protein
LIPIRVRRLPKFCAALPLLFALFSVAPAARGQEPGKNEFGIWGGYSINNPHTIGITGDRPFGELALRYSRTLYANHKFALIYTADILPAEIIVQPKIANFVISGNPPHATFTESDRHAVYGGGINPIGLKVNFLRSRRFQPFWATSEGFVASVEPIPLNVHNSTLFNFDFDLQVGFQVFNASRSRAWMLGYKFKHISNGYRTSENPGVDLNVLFVGYSFFK